MKNKADSLKALTEDYNYLADSFWKNEQGGETRINIFIGIVTLVIGALVKLATSSNGVEQDQLRIIVVISLLALLLLGLITLARMIIRNKATDRYKRGMDVIRQKIKDHFDDAQVLTQYYPISIPKIKKDKYLDKEEKETDATKNNGDENVWSKIWITFIDQAHFRRFGGLAHTVCAINSILAGLIAAAVCFNPYDKLLKGDWVVIKEFYGPVVAAFILSFLLQLLYIAFREVKNKESIKAGGPTHVFGVVYKLEDDTAKYLFVRPNNWMEGSKDEWLLPKGHIENGEGHGEAAIREVAEETNTVTRNPIFLIDNIEFETPEEAVNGKAYLLEYCYELQSQENKREQKWSTYEEAMHLLSYPESKLMLRLGEEKRKKYTQVKNKVDFKSLKMI